MTTQSKPGVANASFWPGRTPDDRYPTWSMSIQIFKDIARDLHDLTVSIPTNENDRFYSWKVFSTRVDMCKVMKSGSQTNLLYRTIFKDFDYDTCCPIRKGLSYSLKDKVIDDRFIPQVGKMDYKLEIVFSGMIDKEKKRTPYVKLEAYGRLLND
jgi:Protein of unknown function (DUF1091)